MEVILLEDVKTLGKKGEIVTVKDNYARNYLLPRKLGVEANSKNKNDWKLKKANEEKQEKLRLEQAKELAEKLKELAVTVYMRSGEGGRTFGSISTKEIAAAAKEQLQLELDKKKIQLEEPIRTLGTHIVTVKLHRDVVGSLTVRVQEQ